MPRALIWSAVSTRSQATPDKISLPLQEERARAWCAAQGFEVVEVLTVPGVSRSEEDIVKMLDDYAALGCFAYHKLREYWYTDKFDVLVAFSYDRLARSTTGTAWVISNTVNKGKKIYLLEDGGYITLEDYRFKSAIAGITVTSPLDSLKAKGKAAKRAMIHRGLPGNKTPLSHRVERDANGKALRVVVNEDLRPFFDALATLFLQGVGYIPLGGELAARGILTPKGTIYGATTLHHLMYNPMTWGNMGLNHSYYGANPQTGRYIYDDDAPVPDGVIIVRGVVEPIWRGALADDLKAELRRREEMANGRAKPSTTYRFSRLAVCGACGWGMVTMVVHGKRKGLICAQSKKSLQYCSQGRYVSAEAVQAFIVAYVQQLQQFDAPLPQPQRPTLEDEVRRIEAQIDRLLEEQSLAPSALQERYRKKLADLGERLDTLHTQQQASHIAQQREWRQSNDALHVLPEIAAEGFWERPDVEINQALKRLMGDTRLVVMDKQVTGVRIKTT